MLGTFLWTHMEKQGSEPHPHRHPHIGSSTESKSRITDP